MLSDRQMWSRAVAVLVIFAGVTAAAILLQPGTGSGAFRSAPLPSGKHPFPAPGETDHYTLSLNDVAAGELTTSFQNSTEDGRESLKFEYTIVPTGSVRFVWDYKLTGYTLMDPRTLRARSDSVTSHSEDKEKIVSVRFDPDAGRADVTIHKVRKNVIKHKQIPIPVPLDASAALVLLRTADWTPEPTTFLVLNGDDLYRWRVLYRRSEKVKVPAGEFDTDVLQIAAHQMEVKPGKPPVPREDKAERTALIWLDHKTGRMIRVQAEMTLGTFRAELE